MRYISKSFLSSCAGETGSIVCEIETPRVKEMRRNDYYLRFTAIEASIQVRDCHHQVNIDLNCRSEETYLKRVAKLDHMISELTKMRGQYVAMYGKMVKDQKYAQNNPASENDDRRDGRPIKLVPVGG